MSRHSSTTENLINCKQHTAGSLRNKYQAETSSGLLNNVEEIFRQYATLFRLAR
jgi:hypothetical protein